MRLPEHVSYIWPTARAFKQDKRQQIRELERALGALEFGCAWMPISCYSSVDTIRHQIDLLKQNASVKNWGR